LKFEKEKNKELAQGKKTISSLKSSNDTLQDRISTNMWFLTTNFDTLAGVQAVTFIAWRTIL
jgi:hypothetical protein